MDLVYLRSYSLFSTGNPHIVLTNDIILNDGYFEEDGTYHDGGDGKLFAWKKITSNYNRFVFNGNNKQIVGLYENSLFGICRYSEVKNCTFKNVYVYNCQCVISDYLDSIENCNTYGYLNYSSGGAAWGMVKTVTSNVYNCKNYVDINASGSGSSGIVYTCYGKVEKCENYGDVVVPINSMSFSNSTGIVYTSKQIVDCNNYGKIVSQHSTAGILQRVENGYKCEIINCKNYGEIKGATSNNVYGIGSMVADVLGTAVVIIRDCCDYKGTFFVGGTSWGGPVTNAKVYIENCIIESPYDYTICSGHQSVSVEMRNILLNVRKLKFTINSKANNLLIKNLYIKQKVAGEDYSKLRQTFISAGVNSVYMNGLLIETVNKKQYYGDSFNAFYFGWKTRKIGLKSFDGTGVYQGPVTEESLSNMGYLKIT